MGRVHGLTVAWRRLDVPGHDCAVVSATSDGWRIDGMAVFVEAEGPACLSYRVEADRRWATRSAHVSGWLDGTRVDLRIEASADGHWTLDGERVGSVDGCVDVDLSFTPATNLLPIRRLALPVGGSADLAAAWLRVPELDLQRLEQTYARRSETRYEYRSPGFRAELEAPAEGLVTSYSGLWEMVGGGRRDGAPDGTGTVR